MGTLDKGPRRIVLTGGPGAGKSVVAAAVASAQPDHFALVPEAATQVYAILRTHWTALDDLGRRDVQRRIYRLQRDQEDRLAAEHPGKVLLLDRGTVDGAAYWPDGPAAYWADLGTSAEAELARYDAVLLLESAAALGLYDGPASNAVRFEDAAGALASGRLLAGLWSAHPRVIPIPATPDLSDKTAAVVAALDDLTA